MWDRFRSDEVGTDQAADCIEVRCGVGDDDTVQAQHFSMRKYSNGIFWEIFKD